VLSLLECYLCHKQCVARIYEDAAKGRLLEVVDLELLIDLC